MPVELMILIGFPFAFAAFWLLIVTILSAASGWRGLQARFPDRDEDAVATFRMASGVMGAGVSMNNILTLAACRTGLRVSIWRIFGPFDRPFFVPWEQISVRRAGGGFLKRATLTFGSPPAGKLQVSAGLADKLAAAASNRWPERSPARAGPIVS